MILQSKTLTLTVLLTGVQNFFILYFFSLRPILFSVFGSTRHIQWCSMLFFSITEFLRLSLSRPTLTFLKNMVQFSYKMFFCWLLFVLFRLMLHFIQKNTQKWGPFLRREIVFYQLIWIYNFFQPMRFSTREYYFSFPINMWGKYCTSVGNSKASSQWNAKKKSEGKWNQSLQTSSLFQQNFFTTWDSSNDQHHCR